MFLLKQEKSASGKWRAAFGAVHIVPVGSGVQCSSLPGWWPGATSQADALQLGGHRRGGRCPAEGHLTAGTSLQALTATHAPSTRNLLLGAASQSWGKCR